MKTGIFSRWLGALCVFAATCAHAADIDVFAGIQPTGSNAPYVLILMDNGASFSANNTSMRCSITVGGVVTTDGTGTAATGLDKSNGGVEQCALYSVISSLSTATTTVNIGIMVMNSTGQRSYDPVTNTFSSACSGGDGGCLVMPITPINSTYKPRILEYIRQWVTTGSGDYNIKGPSSLASGGIMQEAWAYYQGKTGISGRSYSSVQPAAGCAAKHIVYIGNNYNTQASPKDSTTAAGSPKLALNGGYATVLARADPAATPAQLDPISDTITTSCGTASLDTAENKGAWGLNWGRYMKSQSITTYTVGILGPSCDTQYGAWLTKLGSTEVGGGKFFATNDYATLVAALKTILGEVQSVNSVFAAVSLPVSVNTQGSYLNQVYVGMFRPDKNFLPRWNGNLKQYKLGNISNVLRLLDADGKSAINTLTGFVTECARSYWTPNAADTYWALDPQGGCLTVTDANSSNYPDGNIVEKGAQAYTVRAMTPANRVVKTCSTTFASCTTLTDFNTSNSEVTAVITSTTQVNWARGQNTSEVGHLDELDKGTTVIRPSVHGDIVHSRPVPVNHGTDASPSIVVYYGGNDGLLRAVNGNRGSAADVTVGRITSGGNTYNAGSEMWSFMPPEFYSRVNRIYNNTQGITYPGTLATGTAPKDYGFDGPITAFNGSTASGTKTYVFATMRRGGRVIYAFDVTTPGTPALLWKRGCPNLANDTNCSSGWDGIGQTWSSLKPMFVSGYSSGTAPLMITGGGYDDCEDFDAGTTGGANHNCTSTSKGKKVYVIDAATGAIAKAFDTDRPVIADSTLVRDSNDKVIYGYTADMGGNVYRMDFTGGTATWAITKIASFGCDTLTACTANRKFLFAPSVVTTDGQVYSVMLGSGDREKPLLNYVSAKSVTNYFFKFDDRPSDATSHIDTTNCGVSTTVLCKASLLGILSSTTPTDSDLGTKKGWYLGLVSTEQVVTSSITIFGVVTFSTHQPAVTAFSSCTPNLGTTLVYNINYTNAATANGTSNRYEDVSGDGLPPSPVGGRVTLDDGTTVPFCIGCSKDSPLEGSPPKAVGTVIQPKSRLYWYIQK